MANSDDVHVSVFPVPTRKPGMRVVRDFPRGLKRCHLLDYLDEKLESEYDSKLLEVEEDPEEEEEEEDPEEEEEEDDSEKEVHVSLETGSVSNVDNLLGKRARGEGEDDDHHGNCDDDEGENLKAGVCKRQKTYKSDVCFDEFLDFEKVEDDSKSVLENTEFESEEEYSWPEYPEDDSDSGFVLQNLEFEDEPDYSDDEFVQMERYEESEVEAEANSSPVKTERRMPNTSSLG